MFFFRGFCGRGGSFVHFRKILEPAVGSNSRLWRVDWPTRSTVSCAIGLDSKSPYRLIRTNFRGATRASDRVLGFRTFLLGFVEYFLPPAR